MGPKFASQQTHPSHSFVNKTSILAGAEMAIAINPAWKDIIVYRTAAPFKPRQEAGVSIGKQLELHGTTGFLLHYDGARADLPAADKVADCHLHEITTTQIAVDREVKQGPVSKAAALIEVEAFLPDLLGFRARFAPTARPAFQT